MPSQTELSLASLLPTVSYLPPELVALANSLLAQSRIKAASLKPEEEAARTYVCCHIACERLGNKLALDIAQPRPPVKPKVYDKVKTYFNAVLKTSSNPTTPRTRRVEDKIGGVTATRSAGKAAVDKVTPTTTAITSTSARKRAANSAAGQFEAPKFVMPLIRHLCKEYDIADAITHVFAGASSVLGAFSGNQESAKKRRTGRDAQSDGSDPQNDVPAVVTTLFAMTYQRMCGQDLLGDSSERDELVGKAEEYCLHHAGRLGLSDDTDIAINVSRLAEDHLADWQTMEFYHNIPKVESIEVDDVHVDEGEDEGEQPVIHRLFKTPLHRREKHAKRPSHSSGLGAAGLLPGLGTMFQPAIDWLSDERRTEYQHWKRGVLRKINMIDSGA